ncbi:MAG: LysR family transcriptional regulator [Aestuariivirgaceae bacterium]
MHQIRYFLAVSRVLNFTRAAEDCHVAQPSLTRAIKLLEAELGADLFRRERNLTHLTDFGHRMLPLLQQCHDSAQSAKKLASSFKTGEAASLTLGLSHTVPVSLLVEPLTEVVRAFPRLELKFVRGRPAEVGEALKKGEVSLALAGPLAETWDRLDSWHLFAEPFEVLIHPEHGLASASEVALQDLAVERILVRPYCEHQPSFDALLKDAPRAAECRHEVGSDQDLISLVDAGIGIGVVPRSTDTPTHLRRVPLASDPTLERVVFLYGVAGRERSVAATALMKLLRARDWSRPQLAAAA